MESLSTLVTKLNAQEIDTLVILGGDRFPDVLMTLICLKQL